MTVPATKPFKVYRCAHCKRRLRHGRWVYSKFTGNRYCPPGWGCAKP